MRERLASSLDYAFSKVGKSLDVSPRAARDLIGRIRAVPQSPHLFGAYYDMVLALERDDLDQARGFALELLKTDVGPAATRVSAIDDRPAADAERYRRLLLPDMVATSPDTALMDTYRKRLADGFALLDTGFPAMGAEVRGLLREIVVAAGPDDPKALTFDGASSYMLWGAILLNARGQLTTLDVAQALAHESGHNLLFGLCSSGPLVDNPDEELFHSPLRTDARPMDGVFHATYVIARMHQTLSRLLEAGILDPPQMDAAMTDLAVHRRNFDVGDQVIREGARLTAVGRDAITAARDYMAMVT